MQVENGSKQEQEFLFLLGDVLDGEGEVDDVRSFDDAGVLTMNVGLVVRLTDGTEFQVTVVQSGGERTFDGDDDEDY